MSGKVKWYDAQKGWGWITRDDGQGDVFVHFTDVSPRRNLQPGEQVAFEIGSGRNGKPRALNVKVSTQNAQAVTQS